MKKILSILLILTFIMAVLCSCQDGKFDENLSETQSNSEIVSDNSEGSDESDKVDYTAVYAEKLDLIYKIVLMGAKGDRAFLDECYDDLTGVCESASFNDELDNIGYILKDVSNDGIPELIVAINGEQNEYNPGTRVLNVFKIVDDEVVSVADGWYRNGLYSLGNGKFYCRGSGGAAWSTNAIYYFNEKQEYVCDKMHFTSPADDGSDTLNYWCNSNGVDDLDDENTKSITQEEFDKFEKDCYSSEENIDITPISAWGYSNVTVDYFNNATDKNGDYEEYSATEDEEGVKLIFTSDKEISNLKILSLFADGADDDGNIKYDVTELKEYETLTKSLVVEMTFYGDTPNNGFSFTDKFGNEICWTISMSGKDSSIVTARFVK